MPADDTRLEADRRKALGLAISQIEKQLGNGLAALADSCPGPTCAVGEHVRLMQRVRAELVEDRLARRLVNQGTDHGSAEFCHVVLALEPKPRR